MSAASDEKIPGASGTDGASADRPFAALYEGTLDCVHCGMCLPSCPTYRETGRESASPRGRITLMRGIAEGRIPLGEVMAEEAYLCLGCRACETACPSGVRYGALLETARAEVDRAGLRSGWRLRLERFALGRVVARPRRLRAFVGSLALVQRLGLDRLVRPLLPPRLRELHGLLPVIPRRRSRRPLPRETAAVGVRRGRVAFLAGCIMPELFGDVNRATVRVLAANGFDVVVPPGQGCCGALHAHTGDPATAHALAERNVAALDPRDFDALISNSAGCGAALREYGDWLGESGALLAASTRDVCEFLDAAEVTAPLRPIAARVCYDDPCHLIHGQGVSSAPRRLLASIPGIELVAHDDAAACCGAAGIYNVTQPGMSRAVLDRKMRSLAAARPDIIATGNPGCLMQLRAGVAAQGMHARVVHPIELLDEACSAPKTRRR